MPNELILIMQKYVNYRPFFKLICVLTGSKSLYEHFPIWFKKGI